MVRVNAMALHRVVLCMIVFSLQAYEPTDKLSIHEAVVREWFRMSAALRTGETFSFDQDLINTLGFGELMERFYPSSIVTNGIILARNIEVPHIPFRYHVGPEIEFSRLNQEPVEITDNVQQETANEAQPRLAPRRLITELAAASILQEENEVDDSSDLDIDGLLVDAFRSSEGLSVPFATPADELPKKTRRMPPIRLTTVSVPKEEERVDDVLLDFDRLQADFFGFPIWGQVTNTEVMDRLSDMLVDQPRSNSSLEARPRRSQRALLTSPRISRSGQKRSRNETLQDDLQTTPSKRSRNEKDEISEEGFLTPGDLSPIYDFIKPPRTPEDEGGNGGGSHQGGLQAAVAPLRSSKRLNF